MALTHRAKDPQVGLSRFRIEVDHATAYIAHRDAHRGGGASGTESDDVTDPGVFSEGFATRHLNYDVRSESALVESEACRALKRRQCRGADERERRLVIHTVLQVKELHGLSVRSRQSFAQLCTVRFELLPFRRDDTKCPAVWPAVVGPVAHHRFELGGGQPGEAADVRDAPKSVAAIPDQSMPAQLGDRDRLARHGLDGVAIEAADDGDGRHFQAKPIRIWRARSPPAQRHRAGSGAVKR
jgi:hypothetical protein